MCKQFFQKQRVDATGIHSVRLQKLILFFAVIELTKIIFGLADFLMGLLSLLILLLGFLAAFQRRSCSLRIFGFFQIVVAAFAIISMVGLVSYAAMPEHHREGGHRQHHWGHGSNSEGHPDSEPVVSVSGGVVSVSEAVSSAVSSAVASSPAEVVMNTIRSIQKKKEEHKGDDDDDEKKENEKDEKKDHDAKEGKMEDRKHRIREHAKNERRVPTGVIVLFCIYFALEFFLRLTLGIWSLRLARMVRCNAAGNLAHPVRACRRSCAKPAAVYPGKAVVAEQTVPIVATPAPEAAPAPMYVPMTDFAAPMVVPMTMPDGSVQYFYYPTEQTQGAYVPPVYPYNPYAQYPTNV